MLWTASGIKGYAIAASDGEIGTVNDFLFDDKSWLVRWLVVDTGTWLPGRKVLLPPFVLGHPNASNRAFPVRLTMARVEASPDVDTERAVSRQIERQVYDYYGWRPYWGDGFYVGGLDYAGDGWTGTPIRPLSETGSHRHEHEIAGNQRESGDPHLRSIAEVTGYHVHATDGEIGHVEDLLLEDADWSIHYLVVDTKNWWPGKKVLVSPASAHDIDWADRLVNLTVDRHKVEGGPKYDETTTVDRDYEQLFHNHYGDIRAPGQP
jgi:sporulation protein YlmC with PRC-barrel domain